MSALSRLLVPGAGFLARLVVFVFFRRVEVCGLERVPDGPVVLAANHPNSILDPLVVAASFPGRKIDFVAAAFFFDIPVVRTLFRALRVVPVYRREDDPEKRVENRSMFDAVVEALHLGESVGIFPEGNTFADPRLQEFRTGAARITLEAQDRGPEGFRTHLIPVGLNYRDRQAFRSDVLVFVGEPLDPVDYLDSWREDPREAGKALTAALRQGAEVVTRNLDRLEDEEMMGRLERIFRSEVAPVGTGLRERFLQSKRIQEAVDFFRRTDPESAVRVEELLEEYCFGLEVLNLSGTHLRPEGGGYGPGAVARFLARVIPPLVLCTPLALWGGLHNVLPYLLTDPMARRNPDEPQREAVRKVGWGIFFFGVFYLAQTLAVGWAAGRWLAAGYLVTLPLTGFAALWWLDRADRLWRHSRTFLVFGTRRKFRARMTELRERLVEELTEHARRFREVRGEDPDPRAAPLPGNDPAPGSG